MGWDAGSVPGYVWEWAAAEVRRENAGADTAEVLGRGLPSRFYTERQRLSDKVAACVLLDPPRCPRPSELPRERITCEGLRAVLRLAILRYRAKDAASLAHAVGKECGWSYVVRLLELTEVGPKKDFAIVSNLPWYVHQLLEFERAERRHYMATQFLLGLRDQEWDSCGIVKS